jgi:hypothetical protein
VTGSGMRPLEKDGINLWLFQLLCYVIMDGWSQ